MTQFFEKIQQIFNRHDVQESATDDTKPIDLNSPARKAYSPDFNINKEFQRLKRELQDKQTNAESINQLFIFQPAETAWGRFKTLFVTNSYGFRCWEYKAACLMGGLGIAAGFVLRKKRLISNSVERFKVQHNLSLFESKLDYAARLSTFMGLNAIVESVPKGLRIGLVNFIATFTVCGLACIRDKALLSDFVVGYATAGFLYRFQKGFKAAFAAALIGSFLGLLIPLLFWPYCLYTGKTLDGVYKEARQEYYSDKMKAQKLEREIRDAMLDYEINYFAAKKKVKQLREEEKSRMATLHNLNIDTALNDNFQQRNQ